MPTMPAATRRIPRRKSAEAQNAQALATPSPRSREEQIRIAAFALYEARGCEAGHEVEDWLLAEAQFEAERAATTTGPAPH